MPERCTCGAILPEDARFCHKCGSPLYAEDIARLRADEAQQRQAVNPAGSAQPPPLPSAIQITFKNARAVSISLVVAAAALVASGVLVMILPAAIPIGILAAGYVAAAFYVKRSREPLSALEGARLGWMTGLWTFLVVAALSTLMAVIALDPEGHRFLQTVANSTEGPNKEQMLKLIEEPRQMVTQIAGSIIASFFYLTILPALGGVLGAKLLTRSRNTL